MTMKKNVKSMVITAVKHVAIVYRYILEDLKVQAPLYKTLSKETHIDSYNVNYYFSVISDNLNHDTHFAINQTTLQR